MVEAGAVTGAEGAARRLAEACERLSAAGVEPVSPTVMPQVSAVAIPQRVVRRRTKGWRMPPGAVYVGRPSVWGNPFRVIHVGKRRWEVEHHGRLLAEFDGGGRDARAFAVDKLAAAIAKDRAPWSVEMLRRELAGRDLACWCPEEMPCHADLLLEIANSTQ